MANIEQRLEKIVSGILEVDKKKIKKDADLYKDLGTDSLLGLEIIAAIEREFNIKISDDEIPGLNTFNSILKLIKRKLGQE